MTIVIARLGAVFFGAIATVALLVTIAALARGYPDRIPLYLVIGIVAAFAVGRLMRLEKRIVVAQAGPQAPLAARRVPRRPITFPIRETVVTFAFWYVVAVLVDRVVTGTTVFFTLAVIAPFAAFMLTTLTVAGRHMAFRLTAEEDDLPR